jgi:histidyl-tRNA synthetase
VYEVTLVGTPVGSVAGGGRYDGLASRFRDDPLPAVGGSIDLDALVTGLGSLGMDLGVGHASSGVFVLATLGVAHPAASATAAELRAAGIPAELYVGDVLGNVGSQLAHARAKGYRLAAVIGPDAEIRDQKRDQDLGHTVTIEDLRVGGTGRRTIPPSRLVPEVARLLSSETPS